MSSEDTDADTTDASVVESSSGGSQSETVDDSSETSSDHNLNYGPLQKKSKISSSDASKSSIKNQIYAILDELKNVLLNFAFNFQITRPPLVVIETTNNGHITFPIYDGDAISSLMKKSSIASEGFLANEVNQPKVFALKANSFEILSTNWDDFMEHELIPLIKLKMGLDVEVKATLKQFVMLQSGSQSLSICECKQDENKFATFVIQLPSKHEGGNHIVTFNDSTEEFDSINQQFSMNCIALNHDCQHQIMPVTSGVVSYLVYHLSISELHGIPKVPNSLEQEKKATLKRLLSEWMEPGKLIFCLSNINTQENLSFKNLQSDDKRTAIMLNSFSNDCSFQVYLGFLQRILRSDVQSEEYKFKTNNPFNRAVAVVEYNLESLTDVDGENLVDFNRFKVKFADEVSPSTCFDGIKPYRSSRVCSKDDDYSDKYEIYQWDRHFYARYYRIPVIVCFKNQDLISNMEGSDADSKIQMFLLLFKKFKSNSEDKYWRDQLRSHAFDIASIENRGNKLTTDSIEQINLLEAMISFNELDLMQVYFDHYVTLTNGIIPILISQCEKYGWQSFSEQIVKMFDQIYKFSTVKKYLEMFITAHSTDTNKLNVFHLVIPLIIENFITYRDGIERLPEVWVLAKQIGYDIREYSKSLTIFEMVPILIELVECDKNLMDETWIDVAEYFMKEMDAKMNKKPNVSWSRTDASISMQCNYSSNVSDFLLRDVQSITFQMYKTHRIHCQRAIRDIDHVTSRTTEENGMGPITLTKTRKFGQDELDVFNRILELYSKLRSLLQLQAKEQR